MTDENNLYPNSSRLENLAEASLKVSTLRRIVWRNPEDDLYYVIQRDLVSTSGWYYTYPMKGYRHSTSCYAKLGRIYQNEMAKA